MSHGGDELSSDMKQFTPAAMQTSDRPVGNLRPKEADKKGISAA